MPPHVWRFFLLFTGLLLVSFATQLYRILPTRSDIWWTPQAMLVPYAEAQDRAEIYLGGRPLLALLEAGQLRIVDDTGSRALATSEVGLRFNNWDRVRAERLPLLGVFAAGAGASLVLFLLVLTRRLVYRGERERVAP